MAATGCAAAVVIALLAVFFVGASAQSGCTSAIIGLSPCLGFITGNSTAPAASCCSQLASVVSTDPQCLCSVLGGGGSQLGIAINQTQALALPGACNVQTPPVSQCKTGAGRPTTSPPTTPSSTSPSTPTAPQGESKTIPGYGSSDASSINMPLSLASFLGFIWLCV